MAVVEPIGAGLFEGVDPEAWEGSRRPWMSVVGAAWGDTGSGTWGVIPVAVAAWEAVGSSSPTPWSAAREAAREARPRTADADGQPAKVGSVLPKVSPLEFPVSGSRWIYKLEKYYITKHSHLSVLCLLTFGVVRMTPNAENVS